MTRAGFNRLAVGFGSANLCSCLSEAAEPSFFWFIVVKDMEMCLGLNLTTAASPSPAPVLVAVMLPR